MPRQFIARIATAGWAWLRHSGLIGVGLLRSLWHVVRTPLLGIFNLLAALILIFEEWGWKPLSDLFGYLARLKPWARVEAWIAGLPPYGALLVFALPTTILLPVKLVGLWLLANGQALVAGLMLVGAKIVSTALVARIFMLTKPALMRIGWFAWGYAKFMPWKEALFAKIRASWAWRYGRMIKNLVRRMSKRAWSRLKPSATRYWLELKQRAHTPIARLRVLSRASLRGLRTRLGI